MVSLLSLKVDLYQQRSFTEVLLYGCWVRKTRSDVAYYSEPVYAFHFSSLRNNLSCIFISVIFVEERMVSFGATAGDKRATNISMATNEIATELQRIPTGIPVEDGSGNAIHCKSFYVRTKSYWNFPVHMSNFGGLRPAVNS